MMKEAVDVKEPIVFATFCETEQQMKQGMILLESLRKFGGGSREAPFWLFYSGETVTVTQETTEKLCSLKGMLHISRAPEESLKYYFSRKIFASADAEKRAADSHDILAWLDTDTLIFDEPAAFYLPADKSFGYRPVMHQNIGILYGEPLDAFWKRIYDMCGIDDTDAFQMKTIADGKILWPYFNAGCVIVRPGYGLLEKCAEDYGKICGDTEIQKLSEKNIYYKIFLHQACFTASILREVPRDRMLELPDTVNYPIFFREMFGAVRDFHSIEQADTVRYESFLENPPMDWQKTLKGPKDKLDWLASQIR